MSREILFKAKRADNGEWVMGGSIIQFLDDGVRSFYMPQFNEKCICEHDEVTDDILKFEDTRFYKVDGDTICQYTGLNDKNGKKIWENDIIKYHFGEQTAPIKYGTYQSCFDSTKTQHCGFYVDWDFKKSLRKDLGYWICMVDAEPIGNIFDNPELLEESHE